MFVKGYSDAIRWMQEAETDPLSPDISKEFQLEFERMVILDYIIRNTDRGHENWLVKYEKGAKGQKKDANGIILSAVLEQFIFDESYIIIFKYFFKIFADLIL